MFAFNSNRATFGRTAHLCIKCMLVGVLVQSLAVPRMEESVERKKERQTSKSEAKGSVLTD